MTLKHGDNEHAFWQTAYNKHVADNGTKTSVRVAVSRRHSCWLNAAAAADVCVVFSKVPKINIG